VWCTNDFAAWRLGGDEAALVCCLREGARGGGERHQKEVRGLPREVGQPRAAGGERDFSEEAAVVRWMCAGGCHRATGGCQRQTEGSEPTSPFRPKRRSGSRYRLAMGIPTYMKRPSPSFLPPPPPCCPRGRTQGVNGARRMQMQTEDRQAARSPPRRRRRRLPRGAAGPVAKNFSKGGQK
jgi:hypothetical protein